MKAKEPKNARKGMMQESEERLLGEDVSELAVKHHDSHSHGQVHPRLQEGNDLSATARGRHDEHVLGVTENGVVEEGCRRR